MTRSLRCIVSFIFVAVVGCLPTPVWGIETLELNSSQRELDTDILKSFDASWDGSIDQIKVESDSILIQGKIGIASKSETYGLVALPIHASRLVHSEQAVPEAIQIQTDGRFEHRLNRWEGVRSENRDRLFRRWHLVKRVESKWSIASLGRYADGIECRQPSPSEATLATKKGLGGWTPNRGPGLENELEELGIGAVTVNVAGLHNALLLNPAPETVPYVWEGTTYHFRETALEGYDRIFRTAAKNKVMVSAILLINNVRDPKLAEGRLLAHPDATPEGTYAMPNVETEEGVRYVSALYNLIAERWSRADGKFGRVHHWIMHNEVDFGWVWTNAGKKSDIEYLDLYQRSMRLMHLATRQYDPHSDVFISLTHHWSVAGEPYAYGSRRLLELLARFAAAEGEFEWGLAFHPYPQDLFEPKTWQDNQATWDWNTPKITPRNLEVLDAYMHRPEMRFQGQVRKVHLSENGFNSRTYSEKDLANQAAGMALAWNKLKRLPAIQVWHYHNWVDHPDEGGLKIGLRKLPNDPSDPYGKKPIWHLYKSFGTDTEDRVSMPYLEVLELPSWEQAYHRFP